MGDRDLLQVEGVTGGGEPVSAAAAFGAAASAGTASAQKCGQALLDPGEPVVRWLARLPADRETGNSTELAPSGMEGPLALRSRRRGHPGRRAIAPDLQVLIQRMAAENPLWGQRRVQAELTRLGFKVSARTVAKYMRRPRDGSPGWRRFLQQHAATIWACDFLCVQTILFRTLYVFFVIHHASREVLHVRVTQHPTAAWVAQQLVECCGWDREPPRFLIHDRDSRYGAAFDQRLRRLGIRPIRTPFRSPRANAIAERWVRSLRTECLDNVFVFNERHLRTVLTEYVAYFNHWRPHRSIGQRAPCAVPRPTAREQDGKIIAEPVLGGLHHVYRRAA